LGTARETDFQPVNQQVESPRMEVKLILALLIARVEAVVSD
jgi:hypothetical protein